MTIDAPALASHVLHMLKRRRDNQPRVFAVFHACNDWLRYHGETERLPLNVAYSLAHEHANDKALADAAAEWIVE
jgi:hypothetical protein